MPVTALGVPTVAGESRDHGGAGEVKHLESRIVRGGDELLVGRGKGQVPNGVIVSLEALDIVEVGLPVLEHAVVVGRDEPIVRVRIDYAPDGRVVSLHYSLKVEA